MNRRNFINSLAAGSASLSLLPNFAFADTQEKETAVGTKFDTLTKQLLVDWCDGMMRHQINDPDNPKLHGALACPACDHIHGRCSDALYPFLHLANVTGDQKYTRAAIDVYNWAERNVKNDDGSWRNDIRPKAWRGTTIFGAIALAEALHYHGNVLDDETRAAWTARLDEAVGGYLYRDFKKIDFTNLNYGMTGVYGFHLFGELLNNQKYTARGLQFVNRVKEFFTQPNTLLWGEGKPNDLRSGRGHLPVDLGYNVEESINGIALYALEVNDTELLELVTKSMSGHLEFMLPDGAWDNSWGTRSQKWCYWGSRTSDGCQPAFSMMADRNPAFGTAAIRNAELLQHCTADGLIHGGPHYVTHGVKPCIHHTFTHAKVMAFVQDKMKVMPKFDGSTPLPRVTAKGVKHFPELSVWLVSKGPWRATVSAYDFLYRTKKTKNLQQPTGGSIAVLHHEKVGTLLAGSMAKYIMVEPLNMQPQPNEDFAFTPRIEVRKDDQWFTNLYDLKTHVSFKEAASNITFDVKGTMVDEARNPIENEASEFELNYTFEADNVTISVPPAETPSPQDRTLVLPVLSPTGEEVRVVSDNRIEIIKPDGTVVVECNRPLSIKKTEKERVFNMVPGAEAVPIMVEIPAGEKQDVELTIAVRQ
jgi:RNase P/RNase MRP subunit p29